MSEIINLKDILKTSKPVDDATQERMELAIMLLSHEVPTENIDDLEAFGEQVAKLRDSLDDLINDIALHQRIRGTHPHDIKTQMQRTCPVLACLYRIEAMADHRICNDQVTESKLADIRDLAVQGIEERHGGPYTNPIYPERVPSESRAKRWRDLARNNQTTTERE